MNMLRLRLVSGLAVVIAAVALVASVTPAGAFNLRAPQIAVGSGALQAYLNGVGESINVGTDQLDAQIFTSTISGNSTFTLMLEDAGFAANNALGIYNSADPGPTLFQVFPGVAAPGWFATLHFSGGNMVVSLFDATAAFQGQTAYAGVNKSSFGFYLQGPGGTFFTQDARNGGAAQALTFAGTGQNAGNYWLAWEDTANGDRDFNDAVLLLESVNPTPVNTTTWGGLKRAYR